MRAFEQMVLKVHLNKETENQGFDISYDTESLGKQSKRGDLDSC